MFKNGLGFNPIRNACIVTAGWRYRQRRLVNRAMNCRNDSESPYTTCWRDADEVVVDLLSANLAVSRAHSISKESIELDDNE